MQGNLYLTGLTGSGKSPVGIALAKTLGRRFVDGDERVAADLGMPIARAFAEQGEEAVREAEARVVKRLARRKGLVVATGEGFPLKPKSRELMKKSGVIAYLAVSLENCIARAGQDQAAQRPEWKDRAALEGLYQSRQAAYGDCNLRVDGDGLDIAAICLNICQGLFPQSSMPVNMGGVESPLIEAWQGQAALESFIGDKKAVILTDRNVAKLHLRRYQKALGDPLTVIMQPGDASKALRRAAPVYEAMHAARLERGDILVALGGGMVTDLGAFIASTYMRGIKFVLVTTTLVGAVDAAVGGKAAVNLGNIKNLVGLFTIPQAVILDLASLGTLPRKQIAEGLVEAYKTGLILNPELAGMIDAEINPMLRGDLPLLAQVARLSAQAKAQVVSRDFKEGGLRRVLNLGHTYGHALEGYNKFRVSHGQSVAAGLMVSAAISRERGLIDEALFGRIMDTSKKLLPKKTPWPPLDEAWQLMLGDKKNAGGKIIFVLLTGLASHTIVDDVTRDEVARAVDLARGSL